jgi:hypothetical protein
MRVTSAGLKRTKEEGTLITDVPHWLKTCGIDYKWAQTVASQLKKEYPYLASVLKDRRSNRAELDLVLLVHHVQEGRFPVKSKDKRPV